MIMMIASYGCGMFTIEGRIKIKSGCFIFKQVGVGLQKWSFLKIMIFWKKLLKPEL